MNTNNRCARSGLAKVWRLWLHGRLLGGPTCPVTGARSAVDSMRRHVARVRVDRGVRAQHLRPQQIAAAPKA
jgi:hypothetical protein